MSRTTDKQYIAARHWLREIWIVHIGLYAQLKYAEQRSLHDYFRPINDFTEDQAIAHRKTVSALHSALPQRAGRALVKLWAAHQAHAKQLALVSAQRAMTNPKEPMHHRQGRSCARAGCTHCGLGHRKDGCP